MPAFSDWFPLTTVGLTFTILGSLKLWGLATSSATGKASLEVFRLPASKGWAMRLPDRTNSRYDPAATTLTVVSRTRVIVGLSSEPTKRPYLARGPLTTRKR